MSKTLYGRAKASRKDRALKRFRRLTVDLIIYIYTYIYIYIIYIYTCIQCIIYIYIYVYNVSSMYHIYIYTYIYIYTQLYNTTIHTPRYCTHGMYIDNYVIIYNILHTYTYICIWCAYIDICTCLDMLSVILYTQTWLPRLEERWSVNRLHRWLQPAIIMNCEPFQGFMCFNILISGICPKPARASHFEGQSLLCMVSDF